MSGLDEAVERLKSEGYTSEEIKNALAAMKKEAMEQPRINVSIDEYFEALMDEEDEEEDEE